MGIIVLILGIRMIGEGIYNYIDEHNQKDWISTTAYVIDISSEYSGTHHIAMLIMILPINTK